VRRVIAALVVLMVLIALPVVGFAAFEQYFSDRIYPGVSIGNFDVSNMRTDEAAAVVERHYARMLAVFDFNGVKWFAPWREIGVTANVREAARRAYQVGRQGRLDERLSDWQVRQPIAVTFTYDSTRARNFLERHRAEVDVSPEDAGIVLADGLATAASAMPGRELDADATLQDLFARVLIEKPVPVRTRAVPAALTDVSETMNQLNAWLTRPFALQMWWDNHVITRTVTAQERVPWLRVTRQGDRFTAHLSAQGIRDFLARAKSELGPDAAMPIIEVAGRVQAAFARGDAALWFVVPREQIAYTVQRGDTFDALGDRFGIPVARILSANPDFWADGGLVAGEQITIPAQSIMLPVPISPTNQQRIEVNLTTQQLFAYEGPMLVLSTSISSGIPKWRTLIGVFQVQEKVDDAYNKLARIRMPNWLSIYDIGDPGNSLTNGIHALPVLGGGRRLWAGYLGHPVSFGCIVVGIEDSDKLYRWAQIGTPVVIYGKTPPSSLNYDNLFEAEKKTEAPAPTATPQQPIP
jgi:lipoprotein-anchoring transpeptidase ErfK/SrfK